MKKIYWFLAITLPFLSFISCSHSSSSDSTSGETDSIEITGDSVEASDSTVAKPVAEEQKNKPHILSSTEPELEYMRNSGHWQEYASGILPQMAEDAAVYCGKVLNRLENGKKHFVIVDKAKMHLFLYDRYGKVIKKYPIACSRNYGNKRKWGDSRTKEGYYDAEGVYDSTNWLYTNDAGYTSPARGVYGPWFIRVEHPIGIHGTSSPGSIGKRCSHGCIRLNNADIKDLVQYVDKGTPIIISPGPKDMQVNAREGAPTLAVVTEPGTAKATPGSYDMSQAPASSNESKKSDESKVNANKSDKSLEADQTVDGETSPSTLEETKPTQNITPSEQANPAKEETPKTSSPSGNPEKPVEAV